MSDVALLVRQVTVRYRKALLAKAALMSALGVGIVWVLAGRLRAMHRAPLWSVGVPGILAIIGLASLVWWLRRNWISPRGAASHLDHTLDLQQRLTTAAEFARHSPPPHLYSLLIEDTARRFSTERMRFPRLLDRTTATLAIALLLLLGGPWPAHVPLRLAQRPSTAPPTPPSPVEPPPEFPREQQSGPSETSQSSQSSQPSSPSSPSDGGSDKNRSPQGQGGSQRSDDASRQSQGQAGSQRQQAGQSRDQASPQEGEGQQRGGNRASRSGDERAQQRGRADNQARSQESSAQSPESTKGDSADRRGEESGASKSSSEADQAAHESGQRGASSPQSSQSSASLGEHGGRDAGSQSFGGQEAMRADIQQLLKEVSGELKALQAQLAAAESHAQPDAGTSADPQLYESPMKLDRATGNALPVQLQTDTAPTTTPRPGGGVGRPSGEVSGANPSVRPEEAQLSDEPREETPTARQPVPPEYRSVFDRLRQRDTQPTQTRP